jgi:hypothetical protein
MCDIDATLWIDMEDLFVYEASRPSGIQRLAFEIYCALQAKHGDSGRMCFVRHDRAQNSFSDVEWPEFVMLFRGLAESERTSVPSPPVILPRLPARQLVRRLAHRLPTTLHAGAHRGGR